MLVAWDAFRWLEITRCVCLTSAAPGLFHLGAAVDPERVSGYKRPDRTGLWGETAIAGALPPRRLFR
jgi:hypothetical protein